MPRSEYRLSLPWNGQVDPVPAFEVEAYHSVPIIDLAGLMIESYRGTIDSDGETLEDAVIEVENYLAGKCGGPALLDASHLAFERGVLVGACLVVEWQERSQPLVAYVMTRGTKKGLGVGRSVLTSSLLALSKKGYQEIYAVITNGNTPSEHLFAWMGFQKMIG